MYPLRTSWSFWLAVPDALLMNSPHLRRSSLFPESSQSHWGAGDGVGPEFPQSGSCPAESPGSLADFPPPDRHRWADSPELGSPQGTAHSSRVWAWLPIQPLLPQEAREGTGMLWGVGLKEPNRAQFRVCDTHEAENTCNYKPLPSSRAPRRSGLGFPNSTAKG